MNKTVSSNKGTDSSISTNLTWINNSTKVGDNDGPAYVVYSNIGYNKASEVVAISKIKTNFIRKSDKKTVNAYLFLGIDVYDSNTNEWKNCADAGLGFIGSTGKFHAFVNRFIVDSDEISWWESPTELDTTHDYQIILDSSKKDGQMILSIVDVTDENKTVDFKEFSLHGLKTDGSNTAYYQDYAIDFPDDVCKDTNNNESKDWDQVTLYNTDQGLYMKNIQVTDAFLYNDSGSFLWTEEYTEDRFMWPYKTRTVDYVCTTVNATKKDYETTIDLNMNH